jgi:hypothetical protein
MAKRTRGTGRPGQRRPTVRPTARPASAAAPAPVDREAEPLATAPVRRPGSLTAEEEARAAELEAQIVAEERAAEDAQRRTRDRARTAEIAGPRTRESAPLHVKAAAEYAYVRRDIVRILRMGAVLLAVLAVLHVLINVMGVIPA